jgi:signal peptidase I
MDLREIREFLRDCAIYIIIFAIIAFIFTFIISLQPVAGNSMVPTLDEGDAIAVSKLSYKFGSVQRNDIVIIKKNGKSYVKRVIGLPGESIKYIKSILYIDDVPYTENFLDDDVETSGFTLDDICKENECPDGIIPEGKYLVLGDNRPESEDSRDFGLVDKTEIKGKVLFKIWPLSSFGKLN